MSYDIRGNKVAMTDPDKGSWTYSYNPLGQLAWQVDGKGQTTLMAFDALGRTMSRTDGFSTASQQQSTWVYDTATMGVGKLASESGYGYSASVSYDALGRPSAKAETMDDGQHYTVSTSYDSYSRRDRRLSDRPDGADEATRPARQARQRLDGRPLLDGGQRGRAGQCDRGRLRQWRDPVQELRRGHGRLTGILSTSAAAGTIQNLSYQFDTLGNLLSRTDSIQAIQETFQYDTLNRVTASTVRPTGRARAAPPSRSPDDALGNITSKSDIGAYTYGAASACANAFAGRMRSRPWRAPRTPIIATTTTAT